MGHKQNMDRYPNNYHFPIYIQQHDNTCGPACFAMIAEWATGLPQSEYNWCKKLNADAGGVSVSKLDAALGIKTSKKMAKVELDSARGTKVAIEIEKLFPNNINSSINIINIKKDVGESLIYLALIDSYDISATNLQHWIVLVGIKEYSGPMKECKGRNIVIYADPLETRLQAWDWESLKAAKVCALYKVWHNGH